MDQSNHISPSPGIAWQITQKSKEDGSQLPAKVTSQGHSYEWKQADQSAAQKLLDLARGDDPGSSKETVKETLSRFSRGECISYVRQSFHSGQLSGVLQRFLPLRSFEDDAEVALARIEEWAINHADLDSAQSLSFMKKREIKTANYTVYISSSREGQGAALKLSKLIDSIGPEWGLHSSFLTYQENLEASFYEAAIDNADLFIALIDDDYGLAGTRSQLELRYAASLEHKKSWPWLAGIYLCTRHDWVTEVLAKSPPLFLHGKNPKEHIERIAGFMLSLLLRKKRREQTSTV